MLADSPFAADSVLAILGRFSERRETIRRILERIAKLRKRPALDAAFSKLVILAGIKLGDVVKLEAKTLPILDDIMDHDLLGPAIRQGIAQGLEQGRREMLKATEEARHQEALVFLCRQINARFGLISYAHEKQLRRLLLPELEDLGVCLIAANSIDNLFGQG